MVLGQPPVSKEEITEKIRHTLKFSDNTIIKTPERS
jgi:hypothetical protein